MSLSSDSACFLIDPPASLLPQNYQEWIYSQRQSSLDSSSSVTDELRTIEISKSKFLQASEPGSRGEDLTKMTLKDLRAQCRQHNLKITGKRAELEERLRTSGAMLTTIHESGETTSQ
jgi:hypothetical protein